MNNKVSFESLMNDGENVDELLAAIEATEAVIAEESTAEAINTDAEFTNDANETSAAGVILSIIGLIALFIIAVASITYVFVSAPVAIVILIAIHNVTSNQKGG